MGPFATRIYNELSAAGLHNRVKLRNGERVSFPAHMRAAAHFMIDVQFEDTIRQIVEAYPVDEFSDKMPHEVVFVEVTNAASGPAIYEVGPDATLTGVISVTHMGVDSRDRLDAAHLGHWRPKTREVGVPQEIHDRYGGDLSKIAASEDFKRIRTAMMIYATMMELFCEPRLVDLSKPDRPTRRRAVKAFGGEDKLPTVWKSVRWNIGETTTPKNGSPTVGGWRQPYHLRRGHWRYFGDRKTPKGERRPGYPGWWVWFKSAHVGSPAYGVVGHRYEPKLHPEKSTRAVIDLMASRKPEKEGT